MHRKSRIFIVGHGDSIDNSLKSYFKAEGYTGVTSNVENRINMLDQRKVVDFFKKEKPEYVFVCSLRAGGIGDNIKYPAEFIYENLICQSTVIDTAYRSGVKKLLYFGSSCVYPRVTPQPIKETALLTGPLELTNEPYAVGKIAGIKTAQAYRTQYGFNAIVVMPATIYLPGCDLDMEKSHVIGALITKFHKANLAGDKEVIVWGTGKPRREFLYGEDFAKGCCLLMEKYEERDIINIGCGYDVTIKELAVMIKTISGFKGRIVYDTTKPDGTMKKLMDNSRILKLGFKPKVGLQEGIERMYQWYINQKGKS